MRSRIALVSKARIYDIPNHQPITTLRQILQTDNIYMNNIIKVTSTNILHFKFVILIFLTNKLFIIAYKSIYNIMKKLLGQIYYRLYILI